MFQPIGLSELAKPETLSGGLIAILGAGLLTWLGKWMQRRDAKSKDLSTAQATIEQVYVGASKDLIEVLRKERDDIRRELQMEIDKLTEKCAEWERKFIALSEEFQALKKQVNGYAKHPEVPNAGQTGK